LYKRIKWVNKTKIKGIQRERRKSHFTELGFSQGLKKSLWKIQKRAIGIQKGIKNIKVWQWATANKNRCDGEKFYEIKFLDPSFCLKLIRKWNRRC